MTRAALPILAIVAATGAAHAHQVGCDGKPAPGLVREDCCGLADYHRLTFDQISEDDAGYVVHVDGYTFHVPRQQAEPSPDGCPAIFFSDSGEFANYRSAANPTPVVFCFFLPLDL